jgi:LacI family transcriptional regulator
VCGLIGTTLSQEISGRLCEALSEKQMPLVLVDNDAPEGSWGRSVNSDDAQGAALAVDHLLELGHKKLAFLSGSKSSTVAQVRAANFERAMRQRLPHQSAPVAWSDWQDTRIIEAALSRLFDASADRPTALLCAADQLAMVAQRFARQRGLKVPDDLSVVGFANLELSAFADPPLTTISQPLRHIGRAAVQHFTSANSETLPGKQMLATTLVVRESTAARPQ